MYRRTRKYNDERKRQTQATRERNRVESAAQVRYLRDVLRVPVQRKPNGWPMVRRCDWEREQNAKPAGGPKWTRAA